MANNDFLALADKLRQTEELLDHALGQWETVLNTRENQMIESALIIEELQDFGSEMVSALARASDRSNEILLEERVKKLQEKVHRLEDELATRRLEDRKEDAAYLKARIASLEKRNASLAKNMDTLRDEADFWEQKYKSILRNARLKIDE